MTWSNSFVTRLTNASITPLYRLEFLGTGSHGFTGFGNINFSSWNGKCRIGSSGPIINSGTVIPQRWNISLGGFSVPIVGDLREVLPYIRRGMLAELLVDIGTGWERIACGALRNISGISPNYSFQFSDLISAFSNTQDLRADTNIGITQGSVLNSVVFRNMGQYSLTTSPYASPFLTQLQVDELKIFQQEYSLEQFVRVVDSSSGATSYLGWDAKSAVSGAGYLSISNTGQVYPSLTTPTVPISTGSKVYSGGYLRGFPGEILGKLLLSTAAGTNGPLDDYPEEWSLGGLYDQSLFDHFDVINQKSIIKCDNPASYTYEWMYPVEESWTAGLRSLITVASNTGQWPVWRQGKLSWRGCVDPSGASMSYPVYSVMSISDSDIITVESHSFFNPDIPNIYSTSQVIHTRTSSTNVLSVSDTSRVNGKITSLPAVGNIQRDNSKIYAGDFLTTAGKNQRGSCALGDLKRMFIWDGRISEKLVLRVSLRLCVLCPGDIITLSSKHLYGLNQSMNETFSEKKCMVISVSYSFSERFCKLGLAIPTSLEMGQ